MRQHITVFKNGRVNSQPGPISSKWPQTNGRAKWPNTKLLRVFREETDERNWRAQLLLGGRGKKGPRKIFKGFKT